MCFYPKSDTAAKSAAFDNLLNLMVDSILSAMPNKNYVNGRSYEYKAMTLLTSQGYQVIRAAGSHGPWDLIATKPHAPVRCIQIKRVKTHKALRAHLNGFTPEFTLKDCIEGKSSYHTELWVWMDREGWHIKDDGQADLSIEP